MNPLLDSLLILYRSCVLTWRSVPQLAYSTFHFKFGVVPPLRHLDVKGPPYISLDRTFESLGATKLTFLTLWIEYTKK